MNEVSSKPINNIFEKQRNSTNGSGQHSFSSRISKPSQKPIESGLPSLTPLFEIWNAASQDILERKETPQHTIGLTSIDNVLWGLHKKSLMTIGARTSHGKTSWAINMVRNLADSGKRIIYFSLEMSKEQILEKIFCNFAMVNNLDLLHGKSKHEFSTRRIAFEHWISNIKLLIDDKYGYDFPSMLKVVDIIKPDFVFVDYIQMISTKGFRSKVDAIEEYVRKFAELAITQNFGAILISQINRSGVDEPTMSKFKWAGVLEEHSATCLVLSYNKEKGTYVVHIEKQRHGTTGEFQVKFQPEYSKFRDLTDDEIYEIEERKNSKRKTGGLYSGRADLEG